MDQCKYSDSNFWITFMLLCALMGFLFAHHFVIYKKLEILNKRQVKVEFIVDTPYEMPLITKNQSIVVPVKDDTLVIKIAQFE